MRIARWHDWCRPSAGNPNARDVGSDLVLFERLHIPGEFFSWVATFLIIAVAVGLLFAVIAFVVSIAQAQTPPAQAQQAQVQPAPGDPAVEQIDADLRSLVASINARLSAINEDVIQLRERMKQHAPPTLPAPPQPKPVPPPEPKQ